MFSDSPETLQAALKDKGKDDTDQKNSDSYKDYYPEGTDTVLFLFIKSCAAKRGMFGALTYESTLSAKFQLVRVDDGEVVLSHKQEFNHSDILDRKSTEKAIQKLFTQIPVKM
jgi:hypothetical protein